MITDTHTHLFWKSYDADRDEVLERARCAGVERMLVVGTDEPSSRAAFDLCRGRPGLYPTAGIHPHDAAPPGGPAGLERARAGVRELCARPECVAVGETGLDFFRNLAPRAEQLANLEWHVALALELDKPLVIHCRDAHADTARTLAASGARRGVMHCYSMGPAELEPYLALGLHISFSGMLTYPQNAALREAAARVPEDRLLVETDCPFLPPQEGRGRRNEPAFVAAVVRALAEVRGTDPESIARITSANAERLFRLAP